MIREWLPQSLRIPLWGDRQKWGLIPQENDNNWTEWQRRQLEIYEVTQRKGIGTRINDAGYEVMSSLPLGNTRILEIGPGDIRHIRFWQNAPKEYLLADLRIGMLKKAESILKNAGIPHKSLLLDRDEPLPIDDESIDFVVSFYSLEHIYPLAPYLREIHRVLKPGGVLAGAIPTEGGLAWGTGRLLTSRRWVKKNTEIDPDKIICWEHPNFADQVIDDLDNVLSRKRLEYWPFSMIALIDTNLIIRFVYQKPGLTP